MAAALKSYTQTHGISVTCFPIKIRYFVNAGRTRMKQVLIHLQSNAIKYNRAGGMVGVECTVGTASMFWIELNQTAEPRSAAGAAKPAAVAQTQV